MSGWVYGPGSTTSPGGSNKQIQFNDGGSFGGDADLTFDKAASTLTVTGSIRITGKYHGDGSSLTGVTASAVNVADGPEFALQFRRDHPVSGELSGTANLTYSKGATDSLHMTGNLLVRGNATIGNGFGGGHIFVNGDPDTKISFGTTAGGDSMDFTVGGKRLIRLDENGADLVILGSAASDTIHTSGSLTASVGMRVSASAAIGEDIIVGSGTGRTIGVEIDGGDDFFVMGHDAGAITLSASQGVEFIGGSEGVGSFGSDIKVYETQEGDNTVVSLGANGAISGSSNLEAGGNLTVRGNATLNGNTTLGNASGDSITIKAGSITQTDNSLTYLLKDGIDGLSGNGALMFFTGSGGDFLKFHTAGSAKGIISAQQTYLSKGGALSGTVAGAGSYLALDANNKIVLTSAGGSTSPGGSDGNVQFNNGGAFGGTDDFAYNDDGLGGGKFLQVRTKGPADNNFTGITAKTASISVLNDAEDGLLAYLGFDGKISGSSDLTIRGASTLQGNVNVGGNVTADGFLNVKGNTTLGDASGDGITLKAGSITQTDNALTYLLKDGVDGLSGNGALMFFTGSGGDFLKFHTAGSAKGIISVQETYLSKGGSLSGSKAGAGSYLALDANNKIVLTTVAAGGSTSPAGANTNVQFNQNGSFGGNSNLKFDGSGSLTLSGSSGGFQASEFILGDKDNKLGRLTVDEDGGYVLTVASEGGGIDLSGSEGVTVLVANGTNLTVASQFTTTGLALTNMSGDAAIDLGHDGVISASSNISGSSLYLDSDIFLGSDQKVYFESDLGSYIESDSADRIRFVVGGNQMLLLDEDEDRVNIGFGNKLAVGLGNNTTPSAALHVSGTGADNPLFQVSADGSLGALFVSGSGKVGINTIAPDHTLDIAGTLGVANYIYHNGDDDTHILMEEDMINLVAGGKSIIKGDQDEGFIRINNTNANLDTQIMGNAGEVVLHVDAGTGALAIGGNSPKITLDVHYTGSGNPTGLSNDTGGGHVAFFGTSSADLTAGGLYWLNNDGGWASADSATTGTGHNQLLGIALGTKPKSAGMLLKGYFDVHTFYSGSFKKGEPVYIQSSSVDRGVVEGGYLSSSAPTAANSVVRVVGYATDTPNVVYFNPDATYVEIA